jgi:hypothetical protein
MLEITKVGVISNGKLRVVYRLNGTVRVRFFKSFEALDEFKARYALPE